MYESKFHLKLKHSINCFKIVIKHYLHNDRLQRSLHPSVLLFFDLRLSNDISQMFICIAITKNEQKITE